MSKSTIYDYIVIGSGFGGSVSAMRLAEKGYTVLMLERGKRFEDEDFAKSNWAFWKYLYNPWLRSFGVFQMTTLSGVLVLHGAGVGGGSLGYANVLMEPSDEMFTAPAWKDLADWKQVLRPHYDTAKRMLGVAQTPRVFPADELMHSISAEMGKDQTFSPTDVGVFFGAPGEEGQTLPDPFFQGQGPPRNACKFCGGCMVGCRYNAKNTLPKNYLYFAEKWGARIMAEVQATDIQPLPEGQPDGARYEVNFQSSTAVLFKKPRSVRARNVILSAGTIGTLKLLYRCQDLTCSLPNLSPKLGSMVRTNSEALLGATARNSKTDFSEGVAIGSVFKADPVTNIEPVRYPAGSGLIRLLSWPLLTSEKSLFHRLGELLWIIISRPLDTIRLVQPKWAERTTIFLVMQTIDNRMTVKHGRDIWTLFRRGLVASEDKEEIPARIEIGHKITRRFSELIKGIPAGSVAESLFGMPTTAHILGGCPMGRSEEDGLIGLDCQVFNYPGLYVVDGSIMPANPGINPSLTITALAEYAMDQVPPKEGQEMPKTLLGK